MKNFIWSLPNCGVVICDGNDHISPALKTRLLSLNLFKVTLICKARPLVMLFPLYRPLSRIQGVDHLLSHFGIRQRQEFSQAQKSILNEAYKRNPYPDRNDRLNLSQQLNLTPKRIDQWFYNKRRHSSNTWNSIIFSSHPISSHPRIFTLFSPTFFFLSPILLNLSLYIGLQYDVITIRHKIPI